MHRGGLVGRQSLKPTHGGSKRTQLERAKDAGGVSLVAWVPQGDLGHSEWLETGRHLGAISRGSQWWIGDWIRYGAMKWGEKYVEAARVTGYDPASLRNMAWVASHFSVSLRSDKLAWSHYVLLAPVRPPEQKYWIERAIDEKLSVAGLRRELRAVQCENRKQVIDHFSEDLGVVDGTVICPKCGYKLVPPEEPGVPADQ